MVVAEGQSCRGGEQDFRCGFRQCCCRVFSQHEPFPGTFTLERIIAGPSVSNIMPDMAYDSAADRLYIVNNRSVSVVDKASTATGLTAAERIISSSSIASTIVAIYLDMVKDVLYIADGTPTCLVFNNIGTANGPAIPSRTLTITRSSVALPVSNVFVDTTRDISYVAAHVGGPVNKVILAYDNASAITDPVVADRELTFTASISNIAGDGVLRIQLPIDLSHPTPSRVSCTFKSVRKTRVRPALTPVFAAA